MAEPRITSSRAGMKMPPAFASGTFDLPNCLSDLGEHRRPLAATHGNAHRAEA